MTALTDLSIRPLQHAELDAWLALRNRWFPWPVDRARFLFYESLRPSDEPVLQLAASTADGRLVGTAECHLGEEGERYIDRAESFIAVDEPFRHRGLGARLAAQVEAFAGQHGVRWLEAILYQRDLQHADAFLRHRGFKELERYQESWQEPTTISLDRLDRLRTTLAAQGIETCAFSEIDSPTMRAALYRCHMAIQRDMPHEAHADWTDAPFDAWARKVLQSSASASEQIFVARDGKDVVGLTYLVDRGNGDAEVGDTGVIRSHRRRGIALVLKMMATRYAATHGIRRVQTDNRADNVGMLAINRALGFVPGDLIVIFEKTLSR